MNVMNSLWKFALYLLALLIGGNFERACSAQSLHGLKVGSPSASLAALGASSESDSYKGMAVRQWNLPNGNSRSATVGKDGRIVFIESDWNGRSDDSGCDLAGLRFGVTNLTELRKNSAATALAIAAEGIVFKRKTASS